MQRSLIVAVALGLAAGVQGQSRWLINEVNTLAPDGVELINVSGNPLSPSGLCLWWYETRGNADLCASPAAPFGLNVFCVPAGQPPVPHMGLFTITENAGLATGVGTGANIPWFESSDLWIGINRNPNAPGAWIDFVSFGDINQWQHARRINHVATVEWFRGPVARANAGCDAIYRPRNPAGPPVDTDMPKDWRFSTNAEASMGSPNPARSPNPMTWGEGFAVAGNCAPLTDPNTCTELPTLTITDGAAFDPTPGGGFQLTVQSGMTTAPPLTCLLFNPFRLCPGIRIPFVPCAAQGMELYLNPAVTPATFCWTQLPWDPHFAAPMPAFTIPQAPTLVGASLVFQGFLFDPPAGACFIRSTNAVEITVE